MIHSPLGPVGVEDLEPEAERPQRRLDTGESHRGRLGQDRVRAPVSVDPLTEEIVPGAVAQIDREIGDRLVEVDEAVRQGAAAGRGMRSGAHRTRHLGRNANGHLAPHPVRNDAATSAIVLGFTVGRLPIRSMKSSSSTIACRGPLRQGDPGPQARDGHCSLLVAGMALNRGGGTAQFEASVRL